MEARTTVAVMEILTEDPPDVRVATTGATAVQKAAATDTQMTATTAIQIEEVHSEEAVTEEVTVVLKVEATAVPRAEVMDSRKDAAATATPREGVTAAVKAETSARQEEESHSIQTDRQEGLTAVLKEGRALKEEVSDRAEAAHSEARTTEAVSEADRLLRAETTSIQTESHRLSRIHINSAMLTSRI